MSEAAPRREFWQGVAQGLVAAAMIAVLVAGSPRARDPKVVLEAMARRGVLLDERIGRLATPIRRSLQCAALGVFMESRGEPLDGQIAVAWVVRTRSEERGQSPCAVIFAPAQFSWTADPLPRTTAAVANDPVSWAQAQDVAWRVFVLDTPNPTDGKNHFWSGRHVPYWARAIPLSRRQRIGGHTFIHIPYRRAPWTGR